MFIGTNTLVHDPIVLMFQTRYHSTKLNFYTSSERDENDYKESFQKRRMLVLRQKRSLALITLIKVMKKIKKNDSEE